jgi:hypothetical protein
MTTGDEPQIGGQGEDNSPMLSRLVHEQEAEAREQQRRIDERSREDRVLPLPVEHLLSAVATVWPTVTKNTRVALLRRSTTTLRIQRDTLGAHIEMPLEKYMTLYEGKWHVIRLSYDAEGDCLFAGFVGYVGEYTPWQDPWESIPPSP